MMFTELKEKAENGDIQSMNELARCYSMGIDTEVDYDLAFEYLNKASNLGDPVAMSNLAVFYSLGVSVNKDTRMALKLFHDAACKGAMITEYVFQYIRKDEMEKLASEGCAAAAYYYALSLDNSESQKRDVLIKSASGKRLALAICALAAKSCFSNPAKDNQEAKKLFLQAVDSGYDYFHMLCNIALTIQQLGLDDGIIDLVRFFYEIDMSVRIFL